MTKEEMEEPTSSWGSRNRKHASTFMNILMMMMMKIYGLKTRKI